MANEPGGKAGAYKIAEGKEREEGMSNTEQKSNCRKLVPIETWLMRAVFKEIMWSKWI